MTSGSWRDARNVLCVRLDALGDVLMSTPAIRALKESSPGRQVTLLTSASGAAVARMIPELDDVMVYEAPWMKSAGPLAALPERTAADLEMIEELRERSFDAAVIFTVYSQNPLPAALFCHLAGIPRRLAHCRENPYALLTDWVMEEEPERFVRHEVQRQLDLVATVGCYAADERLSIAVSGAARESVRAKLAAHGVDLSVPWLVAHPGATAPSRRYPPDLFAEAARLIALEHGEQVVFSGSAGERELVAGIRHAMVEPSFTVAGELDLSELVALVAEAPLLVSNNTGPAHIAAATGTPVVDIYALTNPQHTPWRVASRVLSHDVPCKYCYKSVCPRGHHDCLRLVSPESVARAAGELLAARRARAGAAMELS
ncbi:MAG TPA: lipopolysaccharide heptosyltransferase II [Gemmatimonadaceae bacterium]|nr:lipopolysaccharide heptosyltransferase II [Gemmatimonadaceae bacterium]